jgi:alpha-L-rhamnosidase
MKRSSKNSNDAFTKEMSIAHRIWIGDNLAINATRLFRRVFQIPHPDQVRSTTLRLFADQTFHLWFNGVYLGRGPTFFHPNRRPVHTFDLKPHLVAGTNVLAIRVHSAGIPLHNYIASGSPGIVARLDLTDHSEVTQTLISDHQWRGTDQTGWSNSTPRRSWAIGFVESFDSQIAPENWIGSDFDDHLWPAAEERPLFPPGVRGIFFPADLPPLRYEWIPAHTLLGTYAIQGDAPLLPPDAPTNAYGEALMTQPWSAAGVKASIWGSLNDSGGGLMIQGLHPDQTLSLVFDLGAQYTGGFGFDLMSDSPGLIEIGWGELIENDRPAMLRKGNTYADRYQARQGANHWLPHGFSSGRYLTLILRQFTGSVTFHRVGILSSEPDLHWAASFSCNRPVLNDIWNLCARTQKVGTQEGLMDCPTREQAAYVGDGNPVAQWIYHLTGDARHWRHLIRETFAVQSEEGLIKTQVFSGMQGILLDYCLLAIVGARNYWKETGDRDLLREILPAADRLIGWFKQRTDENGRFNVPLESLPRNIGWAVAPASAADAFTNCGFLIFIDHPGTGWHNVGDPGIERKGMNTGINALYAIALRALAELHQAVESPDASRFQAEADRVAGASDIFWSRRRGLFSDGLSGDRLHSQFSRQTNTWCVSAGFVDSTRSRRILKKLMDVDDPQLVRCGPYFWSYLLPELARAGLLNLGLEAIEKEWQVMLEGGATTLWETFAGDALDSYCHPWSGAPLDFLLRSIAGIPFESIGSEDLVIKPRPDLISEVVARSATRQGWFHIEWRADGDAFMFKGTVPEGKTATVNFPDGTTFLAADRWTHDYRPRVRRKRSSLKIFNLIDQLTSSPGDEPPSDTDS